MNKNMLFNEFGKPYVLRPAVGDVLLLEGFCSRDGEKISLVTIFSEYDGAYTVNDGTYNHFLSKRRLKSLEVRAIRAEGVITPNTPAYELLCRLKKLGKKRKSSRDAYMDFYEEDDYYLSYRECVRAHLSAIDTNGYLDSLPEAGD